MTDINGAHVTELAVRLQKFFVNQQQVSGRVVTNLDHVLNEAQNLQISWTAQGFASHAQRLEELGDDLASIRFSCTSVRDTAPLAEQDLLELLALVGVEMGEPS